MFMKREEFDMTKKLIFISLCLAFLSPIIGDLSGIGATPRHGGDYQDY